MNYRILVVTIPVILLFSDVSFSAEKNRVRVAIAANLVTVMNELEIIFEADNPGIDIELISGASGNITAQIINGAPYDIFASADMYFPEKLKSEGLTVSGPEVYAEGFLVIFTVEKIDLTDGISAVKNKHVKKISIANPETAPYGIAAVNSLKKTGLYYEVEKNLVYAGNVSQAAQYVITGADIGFVARSLMFDPLMRKYRENVNWVSLPENIAPPLKQGIVLLSKNGKREDAVRVYWFMLSKKAKAVFVRYGYR